MTPPILTADELTAIEKKCEAILDDSSVVYLLLITVRAQQAEIERLREELKKTETRRNDAAKISGELLETSTLITNERDQFKGEIERLREQVQKTGEALRRMVATYESEWDGDGARQMRPDWLTQALAALPQKKEREG